MLVNKVIVELLTRYLFVSSGELQNSAIFRF